MKRPNINHLTWLFYALCCDCANNFAAFRAAASPVFINARVNQKRMDVMAQHQFTSSAE